MMLLLKHMLYFQKWARLFEGTNLYPGFAVMEVPASMHSVSDLYDYSSMTWNPFVGGHARNLYVVRLHGTLAVMHYKAWVPLYILTQSMLEHAISRPAWTLDETKPWTEYNTHFQHLWLTRYYRIVVPVEDMMTSFVHHSTNRYVNWDVVKRHPEDTALETAALAHMVDSCLSIVSAQRPAADTQLVNSMLHRCTECLMVNMTASLEVTFPGTPPTGPTDHHPPPAVEVGCMDLESVPRQEISGCAQGVEQAVCEVGM